jgi:hypothetical protein
MALPVKLAPGNPGGGGGGDPVDELEPQPEKQPHNTPAAIADRKALELRNIDLTGS